MKFETVYNIGDKVWIMNKDKAKQGKIYSISFCNFYTVNRDIEYRVTYDICFDDNSSESGVKQDEIFSSKEDLIKSL